jgi:hypothetical protein
VRRERVRQAQLGGELRSEQAGSQDPERHVQPPAWHRLNGLARLHGPEERAKRQHVLGERVCSCRGPSQGAKRALIRARRPQVDAARVDRFEGAELLRDDERRMIRQHDAARPDPDPARAGGHVPDDHRGGGAGDAGHVVVLGEPDAVIPPALRMLGEIQRVPERVAGRGARRDRREVEHGHERFTQ